MNVKHKHHYLQLGGFLFCKLRPVNDLVADQAVFHVILVLQNGLEIVHAGDLQRNSVTNASYAVLILCRDVHSHTLPLLLPSGSNPRTRCTS